MPTVERKQDADASDPQPGMPGRCGVRLELSRNVAVAADPHRPCQTGDSRYQQHARRADWSRTATRCAPRQAPEKPRRVSLAPSTSHETSSRTSNIGVSSRRSERVATLVAEQHADRPATEPSSTGSRLPRAETRCHRCPIEPGGLGASAKTYRRPRNRRLDTTVHPHDVGAGDVATTARREHRSRCWECAELAPHTRCSEPGFPRIRHTTAFFCGPPPASQR